MLGVGIGLGVGEFIGRRPGIAPKLDLNFASTKSLTAYRGPTPSFSRASTGSYFDGSGVLRYQGYNLCQYSEDFTNAFWTKSLTSASSNVAIAPNGQQTADKIIESASTGFHSVSNTTFNLAASSTASIYLKAGERGFASVEIVDNFRAVINLLDGTVVSNTLASSTVTTENAGNGWWRVKYTTNSSNLGRVIIYPLPTSTFGSYTGDGTSGIFAWGVQVETGATANQYSQTTNSANSGPRFNHTYNGTSWVSRGLLVEEQRTNLWLQSNNLNTAPWLKSNQNSTENAATSPDGTLNASNVVPNTVNAAHYTYQLITSSAIAYSISFYAKKNGYDFVQLSTGISTDYVNFNLNTGVVGNKTGGVYSAERIESVGNGWYRCSAAIAAIAGNYDHGICTINADTASRRPAFAGDGTSGILLYGFQMEAGSFATSLISTTSSSTTRSADVCQITGSDFSGFWNGTEGTLAFDADGFSTTVDNQFITSVSGGSVSNSINLVRSNANDVTGVGSSVLAGGVLQEAMNAAAGTMPSNISCKLSFAYKANDFAQSVNGAAVTTDTSGSIPTVSQMVIGNAGWTTGPLNGHIARLRYFNKRLPNATLQLLSEPDPTLNLQFALNKTLTPVAGPAPSFSRASTGSYFDSTGTLKYANVNLCTYSEQINDPSWNFPSNATITPNAAVSPNGTTTADLLYPTASGANCYTGKSVGSVSLVTHTNSYYLKSAGKTWATIYSIRGSFIAWFNLVNGTVGTTQTGVTATIQNAGNGWWRCSVTRTTDFATGYTFVGVADSNGSESITKNGTDGILVWGAQSEVGNSATDYALTTSSTTAGPRFDHVYSGGQWVSRGLLIEEQRTNLVTYSTPPTGWLGNLITVANSGVAPDGTGTATLIYPISSGSYRAIYKQASGHNCISWYAKASGKNFTGTMNAGGTDAAAWFNLSSGTVGTVASGYTASIVNVGNGWYRCIVSVNSGTFHSDSPVIYVFDANGSSSVTASGSNGILVWGVQAEANSGGFATSLIQTNGSANTRSADVCQITGTSFNWMWNQGEGSYSIEYNLLSTLVDQPLLYANNGSVGESHRVFGSLATNQPPLFYSRSAGSTDGVIAFGATPVASGKIAVGAKVNDLAGSLNGGAVVTDSTVSMPVGINQLLLGIDNIPTRLNGHIAKLIYYPARLTNTKLQQLST